jgi:hypothetical protein
MDLTKSVTKPEIFMSASSLSSRLGIDPRTIRREPDGLVISGKRQLPVFRISPAEVEQFTELRGRIFGK